LVRTIGVVIGIPEPWGSLLDEHRRSAGDPMATSIPSHLTLLGPTEVDPSTGTLAAIEAHLAAVAATHAPFAVRLAGTGTFRPVTQVVFVAVAAGVTECGVLAADIRSGPLTQTLAYPYHPHVTVAHDVPTQALDLAFARLADFEAAFPVAGFTLYEHDGDGRWQARRRYQLGLAVAGLPGNGVTASEA
jgi:2'-5' RNA ligase